MSAYARLFIQAMSHPSNLDREVVIPLEEALAYETFRAIDLPAPGADGFERSICTSEAEIMRVTKLRKEAAAIISKALTEAILDAMSCRDTVMGYGKEES